MARESCTLGAMINITFFHINTIILVYKGINVKNEGSVHCALGFNSVTSGVEKADCIEAMFALADPVGNLAKMSNNKRTYALVPLLPEYVY